jgi:hypothetical protein
MAGGYIGYDTGPPLRTLSVHLYGTYFQKKTKQAECFFPKRPRRVGLLPHEIRKVKELESIKVVNPDKIQVGALTWTRNHSKEKKHQKLPLFNKTVDLNRPFCGRYGCALEHR